MVIRRDAHHLPVATQTDTEVMMSGKIIPAIVAAMLVAGTAAASAQAPSAEGAGTTIGEGFTGPSSFFGGPGFYYDYVPGPGYNDYAPGPGYNDYAPGPRHPRRGRVEGTQPGKSGW
jgi:hypothetical protein